MLFAQEQNTIMFILNGQGYIHVKNRTALTLLTLFIFLSLQGRHWSQGMCEGLSPTQERPQRAKWWQSGPPEKATVAGC